VKEKFSDQHCNICGRSSEEVDYLLRGLEGNICNDCIMMCYKILNEDNAREELVLSFPPPLKLKLF